jgi:dTDP-4-dehydrorhamnose 3,5-epimerase
MVIRDTALAGTHILEPERLGDARGFFARLWSVDALDARGLVSRFNLASVSFNIRKGTLRGMHYQAAPYAETKLVRCTRGAIYDVALDLRAGSPTFRRWIAAELTAENRRLLYIPAGCAHGFQTLAGDSEVEYMIDADYSAAHGRGVRWNDPAFAIDWPAEDDRTMNDRDRQYPDFLA